MVSIVMISPNLQLTKCDTGCVSEICQYRQELQKLKDMQNSQNCETINCEIEYLNSYIKILRIMNEYFTRNVLTVEEEQKGIDLVDAEMANFKRLEKRLGELKKYQTANCLNGSLDTICE